MEPSLGKIDRNLLQVLLYLLEMQSVTKVAEELGQSVPAVSMTLRRLREMTGDPLLIRNGNDMLRSKYAEDLLPKVKLAISGIDRVFSQKPSFDPQSARDTFLIATASSVALSLLPALVNELRSYAPGIRLHVRSLGYEEDYQAALMHSHVDFILGDWPNPPETLRRLPLLQDNVACLVSAKHGLAAKKKLTKADYLRAQHIAPAHIPNPYHGPIAGNLARLGLRRDVVVEVPEFNIIPYILLESDLVFTTTERYCRFWANQLDLAVVPAPDFFDSIDFYMLWHERVHLSPAHQWFRSQLRDIVQKYPSRGVL